MRLSGDETTNDSGFDWSQLIDPIASVIKKVGDVQIAKKQAQAQVDIAKAGYMPVRYTNPITNQSSLVPTRYYGQTDNMMLIIGAGVVLFAGYFLFSGGRKNG